MTDDNGESITKQIHLTPQNTKLIVDLLENRGLIISDVEHFDPYEDEDLPFPSWAIIKAFRVIRFGDRYPDRADPMNRFQPRDFTGERKKTTHRGGNFFRWFASDKLPKEIIDWLKRYQIITRKGNKTILKDSCAIYALKQSGVSEELINKMRITRLSERFIGLTELVELCDEFNIKVSVRDCETTQETKHHKNEQRATTNDGIYNVKLCYYKEHYLLDEETPFTRDNIRNVFKDDKFSEHIGA